MVTRFLLMLDIAGKERDVSVVRSSRRTLLHKTFQGYKMAFSSVGSSILYSFLCLTGSTPQVEILSQFASKIVLV
jgi:hypothetical protein